MILQNKNIFEKILIILKFRALRKIVNIFL
jgi:hypothetical protein